MSFLSIWAKREFQSEFAFLLYTRRTKSGHHELKAANRVSYVELGNIDVAEQGSRDLPDLGPGRTDVGLIYGDTVTCVYCDDRSRFDPSRIGRPMAVSYNRAMHAPISAGFFRP